jgi:hypothetical protein
MESISPQHDVTGTVNLEAADDVADAVCAVLRRAYPDLDEGFLRHCFADLRAAFWGEYPGLLPCDTPYHDLRHSLDVALLVARMVDGYAREHHDKEAALGAKEATLAVVLGLFHDIGFLRRAGEKVSHGAQLMSQHEERSVEFMRGYLRSTPRADWREHAELIHTTNFAKPAESVIAGRSDRLSVIARMLGGADLLSQMADRYYLERARDFLYREFVIAGTDRIHYADGSEKLLYANGEDLLAKTPEFYDNIVHKRLTEDFGDSDRYLTLHFGGENPYRIALENNLACLRRVIATGDFTALRRRAVPLLPDRPDVVELPQRHRKEGVSGRPQRGQHKKQGRR